MKPRLLFLIRDFAVGGIQMSLIELLKALPLDNIDVTVARVFPGLSLESQIPESVRLTSIPSLQKVWDQATRPRTAALRAIAHGRLSVIPPLVKSILSRSPLPWYDHLLPESPSPADTYDLAINYMGPSEILDRFLATQVSARRKAVWIHFEVDRFFNRPSSILRDYTGLDRIYVVSESARQQFAARYPTLADRTRTFTNIIDHDRILALAAQNPLPQSNRKRIVTVGRIVDQKRQDRALQVAQILRARGIDFVWHLIGEGARLNQWRALTSRLNLDDCIRWEGLQQNPYPFMAAADCYVQTSDYEGYCITLAEARCFSAPIVTTPFSGAEQIVGRPGSAIAGPDPNALADAIIHALNHGPVPPSTPDSHKAPLQDLLSLL